jgi:hypothetical protein
MRAHGGGRPPVELHLYTVADSFGVPHLQLQVGDEWIWLSPDTAIDLSIRLQYAAADLLQREAGGPMGGA